jgi:hypothetical protein
MAYSTFRAPVPPARLAEQRRAPRFACGLRTWARVHLEGGAVLASATVRDLSTSGVCLVLRRRLWPGAVVPLDLFHALRFTACHATLRVVDVAEYPDGNFLVRGAFTRDLTPQEVRELL